VNCLVIGSLGNGRQHESPPKAMSLSKLDSQLPHAIAGSALRLARCQQDIIQQMATPTKTVSIYGVKNMFYLFFKFKISVIV